MGKSLSPPRKWGERFVVRRASDQTSTQPSLTSAPARSRSRYISYWMLPLFSSLVWLGMLLGMLLYWTIVDDSRHLPSMSVNANVSFISDIGAFRLKPLFIAGSTVTAVTLNLAFVAERWLRHNGRLLPNTSLTEKLLSALTIFFAVLGAIGLICLTIFDTWMHHEKHNGFLVIFIGGYLASSVSTCWEYQRLGIKNRQHPLLRISFWVKLAFFSTELVLVILFGSLSAAHQQDAAAVFEWIVAFIFTFYILSFVIDLWPAVHTKHPANRFEKPLSISSGLSSRSDLEQSDAANYP
ncbi:hypothetical protein L249_5457 [Ophiocordyceps polyrhachis-furcata BCC 54312]|uniref:CWH43-like N-terminal domain-containing protein n=1 Tax=Ophiocordyceps polyrhachis-furcata BCC 54312 TaxID=1330021 RepID=A0A367LGX7_9HYPO|nr:hypothetical protein L249_5457 [Ophiocordyceps polyrhachis-furcata BCC 54312]